MRVISESIVSTRIKYLLGQDNARSHRNSKANVQKQMQQRIQQSKQTEKKNMYSQ